MKIVYGQPAVLVMLVTMVPLTIDAPSVYAETTYQSGFKHGVADGKLEIKIQDSANVYILQPGQGFPNHTDQFIQGYMDGYCSIKGLGGLYSDDTAFECH